MKIHEILDNAAPFEVDQEQTADRFLAHFTAGKREIVFNAIDHDGAWNISFMEVVEYKTKSGNTFKDLTYDMTGSGKEFDVFATLKAIMSRFIKDKDPKTITFSARKNDSSARSNVYAKLFKKHMPPGWRIDQDEDDNDFMPETFFTLTREKP